MKYDAYKIKSYISAYDFYLREQNLDRFRFISNQWAIAGLCPFHEDTKTGSFKINLKTGAFKCWSCGAAGGDIISFLQKRDHTGFIERGGRPRKSKISPDTKQPLNVIFTVR